MSKLTKEERRINILIASLEELESQYDKVLDELIVNETEANRNKERALFKRINETKKELMKLNGDSIAFSDDEIEAMATGVSNDKQELTAAEEKLFDAMAENY